MSGFDDKMRKAFRSLRIEVGDVYEDCAYHPVLCLGVDYKHDNIWGVSLIDGSFPRNCSLIHCGIRKISLKEAWQIKLHGPPDKEAAESFPENKRWWQHPTGPVQPKLKRTILPTKTPKKRSKNEVVKQVRKSDLPP